MTVNFCNTLLVLAVDPQPLDWAALCKCLRYYIFEKSSGRTIGIDQSLSCSGDSNNPLVMLSSKY